MDLVSLGGCGIDTACCEPVVAAPGVQPAARVPGASGRDAYSPTSFLKRWSARSGANMGYNFAKFGVLLAG